MGRKFADSEKQALLSRNNRGDRASAAMDPDANPGLQTPTRPDLETPVSTLGVSSGRIPASDSATPAAGHAELASGVDPSASESARREALRALAATAAARGIPLRVRDGSRTSSVSKSAHGHGASSPSAFDASPTAPRRRLALADPVEGASANPFRRSGRAKETKETDRAEALEAELKFLRRSFERERDALCDVAEKVKRRAAEETADAEARFAARARVLENEKEALVAERDAAVQKSTELEAAASSMGQKCERLFAGERAQCAVDVENTRAEAAEEIARREAVWARERAALAETAVKKTKEEATATFEAARSQWTRQKERLETDLSAAETRRAEELAEAESRRLADREALEARLKDAEARRAEELAEAESRRVDALTAAAANAARERDTMLAAWQQERARGG